MTTFLLFFFVGVVFLFFLPVFTKGLLPIPSDTIIGLYHPYRDLLAKEYPNGIPFKNFLITDPVRQQYPWRELAIAIEKKLQLPLWNPYSFAGTPLFATMQSGALYPLNILFFIFPFSVAWTILIIVEPILTGLFLYYYLVRLRIHKVASILGALALAFSGFSVVWLEWNTLVHVLMWLPLILLAQEKLLQKFSFRWSLILVFAQCSQFFAGHLQVLFYSLALTNGYLLVRIIQIVKNEQKNESFIFIFWKKYKLFFTLGIFVFIVTAIQWIPTIQLIGESARSIDQSNWQQEGWFLPWQHLIQFVVPDFFGNPTTLNYWGAWNYAELVGYVGIFPLLMAFFALFFRHDKKTLFFGCVLFLSLIFSLPTPLAKLPYMFSLPFFSTAQPTRLLFLIDFSIAVLAAFGFDYFLKNKKGMYYPLGFFLFVFIALWGFIMVEKNSLPVEYMAVAKRNLLLPTIIAFFTIFSITLLQTKYGKKEKISILIYSFLFIITAYDLLRFATKFNPFTDKKYLFPQTKALVFLQKHEDNFRFMTTDEQIFPPNFSTIYRLQTVDGYDPLYIRRYAELIATSQRGKPDIDPPFGFNRIITPHRYDSKIIDLLGVKYVLSLSDIDSPKLKKVFQEGQTRVYENINVFPRAFFVENIEQIIGENKKEVIQKMFDDKINLQKIAIIEGFPRSNRPMLNPKLMIGKAEIFEYSGNKVIVKTENNGYGFLVFTDSFYPTWHAKVDGVETKIYRTDYNFRGIFVPKGKHSIEFYITL